jgi:hypothetical protein
VALVRGDLDEVERRLREWVLPVRDRRDSLISRLNAFVALGRHKDIEQEAPPLLRPGTYPEPFALRALGSAREDAGLISQAIERFQAMGLEWHAQETRHLAGSASRQPRSARVGFEEATQRSTRSDLCQITVTIVERR